MEKLFRRCLVHPQSHVRIEAIQGLARLSGPEAEAAVVGMLDDKVPEVRQRAVGALADTGIALPATMHKLTTLLNGSKGGGEALALQVISVLNKLRPAPFPEAGVEDSLLELARPKRRFSLGGKETALSVHLREGAVQALGYVGSERCRKTLEKCAKEELRLARLANEAISRLNSRGSS